MNENEEFLTRLINKKYYAGLENMMADLACYFLHEASAKISFSVGSITININK